MCSVSNASEKRLLGKTLKLYDDFSMETAGSQSEWWTSPDGEVKWREHIFRKGS